MSGSWHRPAVWGPLIVVIGLGIYGLTALSGSEPPPKDNPVWEAPVDRASHRPGQPFAPANNPAEVAPGDELALTATLGVRTPDIRSVELLLVDENRRVYRFQADIPAGAHPAVEQGGTWARPLTGDHPLDPPARVILERNGPRVVVPIAGLTATVQPLEAMLLASNRPLAAQELDDALKKKLVAPELLVYLTPPTRIALPEESAGQGPGQERLDVQ